MGGAREPSAFGMRAAREQSSYRVEASIRRGGGTGGCLFFAAARVAADVMAGRRRQLHRISRSSRAASFGSGRQAGFDPAG